MWKLIFWKYCIKRLENPISIVLSNSIVWKCFRGIILLTGGELALAKRTDNLDFLNWIACFNSPLMRSLYDDDDDDNFI